MSENEAAIFNSWKEIASYLGSSVRTVQRWEVSAGLPVRRPRGKAHDRVIATRVELDEWVRRCPTLRALVGTAPNDHLGTRPRSPLLQATIERSHALRTKLETLRTENRVALAALVERLQQMQQASIRRPDHSRTAVFPS